jgi:hypothetical protein
MRLISFLLTGGSLSILSPSFVKVIRGIIHLNLDIRPAEICTDEEIVKAPLDDSSDPLAGAPRESISGSTAPEDWRYQDQWNFTYIPPPYTVR